MLRGGNGQVTMAWARSRLQDKIRSANAGPVRNTLQVYSKAEMDEMLEELGGGEPIDAYTKTQVDNLIAAHADMVGQTGKELGYGERTSNFPTTNTTSFASASGGTISGLSCQFTGDGGIAEVEAELNASVGSNVPCHWSAWFIVNSSVGSAPGGYMNSAALAVNSRTSFIGLKRRFPTVNGQSYTITIGVAAAAASGTTLTVVGSSTNPMWVSAVKR